MALKGFVAAVRFGPSCAAANPRCDLGEYMTRLVDRRTRLVVETSFLVGKRPLIATVEPWGLKLREKGRRLHSLMITWAQVWNRAAMIAAEQTHAEREHRHSVKGRLIHKTRRSS
jgi:hypothetical protein